MLHITNGESVVIPQTGLPGQVIYWHDTLHDGPVPYGLTLQELSRIRERFLAEFFGFPASFAARDEAVVHFADHEEVVLWFEHDLFDQLNLIQILDWFSRQELGRTRLSLISVNSYLGHMQPDQLAGLFPVRHTVTTSEFTVAQRAWKAFCSTNPLSIQSLLDSDSSALPFLHDALLRHLQQFPAVRSGLARTELQILQLAESGLHRFQELFPANQNLEEAIWMGDSTFQRYLRGLAGAKHPLLSANEDRFEVTPLGREILAERLDHIHTNGINRWRGGVHLCDGSPVWRWDEAARTIRP